MDNYKYVDTKDFITQKIVEQNKMKINYLYASFVYYEYLNALNELKTFEEVFNNDIIKTMLTVYNNDSKGLTQREKSFIESQMIKYYVLYLRTTSLASEACESYAKAILVNDNEPVEVIREKYNHNLYDIYNKLKPNYQNHFLDFSKDDEKALEKLSPEETGNQINIKSRYPGEFTVTEQSDVVFKLLEDLRDISIECGNNEKERFLKSTYKKNEKIKITDDLRIKYINQINFMNSNLMTEELSTMTNMFGYYYIFNTKQIEPIEKVETYTLRSRIIKKSCDVIEHCGIYLNVNDENDWDNMRRIGHNLRKMFNSFGESSKMSIAIEMLFNLESLEEQEILTDALINSDEETTNLLLIELIQKRSLSQPLNIKQGQERKIRLKNGSIKKDVNIDSIFGVINRLFTTDVTKSLNITSRFPGYYYIPNNAALVFDVALAVATEALVIEEKPKQYNIQ